MKLVTRIGLFILFVLLGLLVFGVGGYWAPSLGGDKLVYRILICLGFAVLWLLSRQIKGLQDFQPVVSGFFIAAAAFLVGSFVSEGLGKLLGGTTNSLAGISKLRFSEMLPLVVTILVLNRLFSNDLGAIYLKSGNLKLNLLAGGGSMVVFAIIFYVQSQAQGISIQEIIPTIPWILLFALSNAFLEELHFRGLFLRKFESFFGKHFSNLAIAIFFTLIHAPVEYTPDILQFLVITFFLSLGWAYLIQRSDSLWGAVLSHAGADFLVIAGVLSLYVN
jgi:membrane protease YdiL (CAAX protease family)